MEILILSSRYMPRSLNLLLLIADTSRSKKSSEVDGDGYFFVSKSEMEREIQNKRWIKSGGFAILSNRSYFSMYMHVQFELSVLY